MTICANVMPIFKKGQNVVLRNSKPVNLITVPHKVMEQIILTVRTHHSIGNQAQPARA